MYTRVRHCDKQEYIVGLTNFGSSILVVLNFDDSAIKRTSRRAIEYRVGGNQLSLGLKTGNFL